MSSKTSLSSAAIIERRQDIATRLAKVQSARCELALPALEGDADAKRKDEKHAELERQYREALTQFDAALEAAKAREEAARREAKADAKRAKALAVQNRIENLQARGANLDLSAKTFVASLNAFEADILELSRLGVERPSRAVVANGLKRATETLLMSIPSLKLSHLAPHERCDFAGLTGGYVTQIEAWVNEQMSDASEQAA
jgi:hypothetical protein